MDKCERLKNANKDNSYDDKFIFLNPIFIDKLDYLDLKESKITYFIIIILIILIIITLYYFYFDELSIIYYFLIKKKYKFNEIEEKLIEEKVNEFNKLFVEQNYKCYYNIETSKYLINTKDNIDLQNINGDILKFNSMEQCSKLLNEGMKK